MATHIVPYAQRPYVTARFTREDYMSGNGPASPEERARNHRRFYAQLVGPATRHHVALVIGIDRLLASTCPHFNDIPLARWDRAASSLPAAMPMAALGDYWTQSGLVCTAKEAARQLVDARAAQGGVA